MSFSHSGGGAQCSPAGGFIMMDYRKKLLGRKSCNLNCPPVPVCTIDFCGVPKSAARLRFETRMLFCCRFCVESRAEFAKNAGYNCFTKEQREKIKSLWSDETGFASVGGCKLPRDLMPTECLEYDCRKYDFAICFHYNAPYWEMTRISRWREDNNGTNRRGTC